MSLRERERASFRLFAGGNFRPMDVYIHIHALDVFGVNTRLSTRIVDAGAEMECIEARSGRSFFFFFFF